MRIWHRREYCARMQSWIHASIHIIRSSKTAFNALVSFLVLFKVRCAGTMAD